jgi:hypothetical protein
VAWKRISSASCPSAHAKIEVSWRGMRLVYETSEVIVVPSIQYRKADQSDGRAMGMMYSRGLNLSFVLFCFLVDTLPHAFLSFMSRWIDGGSPRRVS